MSDSGSVVTVTPASYRASLPQYHEVVNVYSRNYDTNVATCIAKNIPLKGMRQISKRFEREEYDCFYHEDDDNVLCWDLPDDEVAPAAAVTFFQWVCTLNLPFPQQYNGRRNLDIKPEWGIKQLIAFFELMKYLELGPRFDHYTVKAAIHSWVTGRDNIKLECLIKIYHLIEGVDHTDHLRRHIFSYGIEYATKKAEMKEWQKVVDEKDGSFKQEWDAKRAELAEEERERVQEEIASGKRAADGRRYTSIR